MDENKNTYRISEIWFKFPVELELVVDFVYIQYLRFLSKYKQYQFSWQENHEISE